MLNSVPVPPELGKGKSRHHSHVLLQAAPAEWESSSKSHVEVQAVPLTSFKWKDSDLHVL